MDAPRVWTASAATLRTIAGFLAGVAMLLGAADASCAEAAKPSMSAPDPLVARSQALLDAVGVGDKKVWAETLADDCLITDEEGVVRDKAAVVAEIRGLPAGVVGSLKISDPHILHAGDVAILTYEALEHEELYGQILNPHYHTTETYRQVGGTWKLIASQTTVLQSQARPLGPSAPLTDFVGAYRVGDRTVLIAAEAGSLTVHRKDGTTEVLIALGGDLFARKDQRRVTRIFIRDASGTVTGYADRRENNDLIWSRIAKSTSDD